MIIVVHLPMYNRNLLVLSYIILHLRMLPQIRQIRATSGEWSNLYCYTVLTPPPPPIGFYQPFVIGWYKYRLGLPRSLWIVADVTGGIFHRFSEATDTPVRAVQGYFERFDV